MQQFREHIVSEDVENIVERFMQGISPELKDAIRSLLDQPRVSADDLLASLEKYTLRIDVEARRRGDLDVNLAEEILRVYRDLLTHAWPALQPEQRRIVTAGCSYYLDRGDRQGDLDSVFGFDDDARILNQVLEVIGRSDLRVAI